MAASVKTRKSQPNASAYWLRKWQHTPDGKESKIMKTILLHIHQDAGQESRLQCALDLARTTNGHVICVQITPFEYFATGGDFYGSVNAFPIILDAIREREKAERDRIEAHLTHEDVSWDWRHFDGNGVYTLISEARLADVIILSQQSHGTKVGADPLPVVAEVAIHARAPVFVVPPRAKGFDPSGVAMIAWNGSPECAQAVRLALSLLQRSGAVHIVEVSDDTSGFPAIDAATHLARHGIICETLQRSNQRHATSATLLRSARDLGAAYIVMGAYGHSRLRETILGGVTREMLSISEVPLLLAH
jgi:nucleotide-binding universal stress UspA family protein